MKHLTCLLSLLIISLMLDACSGDDGFPYSTEELELKLLDGTAYTSIEIQDGDPRENGEIICYYYDFAFKKEYGKNLIGIMKRTFITYYEGRRYVHGSIKKLFKWDVTPASDGGMIHLIFEKGESMDVRLYKERYQWEDGDWEEDWLLDFSLDKDPFF